MFKLICTRREIYGFEILNLISTVVIWPLCLAVLMVSTINHLLCILTSEQKHSKMSKKVSFLSCAREAHVRLRFSLFYYCSSSNSSRFYFLFYILTPLLVEIHNNHRCTTLLSSQKSILLPKSCTPKCPRKCCYWDFFVIHWINIHAQNLFRCPTLNHCLK